MSTLTNSQVPFARVRIVLDPGDLGHLFPLVIRAVECEAASTQWAEHAQAGAAEASWAKGEFRAKGGV